MTTSASFDVPGPFPRDPAPSTLRVRLRDRLRHEIVTGILPGGSHLVQGDLAEAFGVSTTPVREALQDLAAEGFIELNPRRGAFVKVVGPDDAVELYEILSVLEPLAVSLAVPRLGSEQLGRLDHLWKEMAAAENPGRWIEMNRDLHQVFLESCGRPRLASMIRGLLDTTYVAVALTITEDAVLANRDHRLVVEAARAGQAAAAAAHMKRHIMNAKSSAEKRLTTAGPSTRDGSWGLLGLATVSE